MVRRYFLLCLTHCSNDHKLSCMKAQKTKIINLALQGGGSHGAFTWGVLDRLLQDERLEVEAITGASSGAINAAVMVYGFAKGGREGARDALRNFWNLLCGNYLIFPPSFATFDESESHMLETYLALTRIFAPGQLNPLNMNPLRELVMETIEFDYLRSNCPIRLFIATTQVRTGKLKIFENCDMSVDTLLASACLPSIHHPVQIDGEIYWDGGLAANPPIFPLIFNCRNRDIIIVVINPLEITDLPTNIVEIRERLSDIGINTAFLREMRAIAFCKNMIAGDWLASGKLHNKMKRSNIHLIRNHALATQFTARSRYNTLPSFINLLYNEGHSAADIWLENNYETIGKQSSVDLAALFC